MALQSDPPYLGDIGDSDPDPDDSDPMDYQYDHHRAMEIERELRGE